MSCGDSDRDSKDHIELFCLVIIIIIGQDIRCTLSETDDVSMGLDWLSREDRTWNWAEDRDKSFGENRSAPVDGQRTAEMGPVLNHRGGEKEKR